ncbi:MAG: hypothetical protein IPJ34_32195 [Myxococcales bacterium]|nr:hypothetical protein [Myxococcales bacterium]
MTREEAGFPRIPFPAGYEWLPPIVQLLGDFAETHHASNISRAAVDVLVTDLLFGRRALWQAFEEGLVTQDEVVDAMLDRFSNEVTRASAPSNAHWAALRSELAGWLFPPGG